VPADFLFLHRALAAAGEDEKKASGVKEYIDIYGDLRSRCVPHKQAACLPQSLSHLVLGRYLPLFEVMIPVVRTIPDIRTEAGQLNLRYERQEPSAIKIFRKVRKSPPTSAGRAHSTDVRVRSQMVTDCLSGVQETLNTCAPRAARWQLNPALTLLLCACAQLQREARRLRL